LCTAVCFAEALSVEYLDPLLRMEKTSYTFHLHCVLLNVSPWYMLFPEQSVVFYGSRKSPADTKRFIAVITKANQ
jgi:hypothetical protein